MGELKRTGIEFFAKCLMFNKALKSLDLSFNDIEGDGSAHLACALKAHPSLASLNLYKNRLGEGDIKIWIEVLECNINITELVLGPNDFSEEILNIVAERLEKNQREFNKETTAVLMPKIGILDIVKIVLGYNFKLPEDVQLGGNKLPEDVQLGGKNASEPAIEQLD